MNDRPSVQLLLCTAGVALFGVVVLTVAIKLGAPVFLPGGLGIIVALHVLGQRLWRSAAPDAAHGSSDV